MKTNINIIGQSLKLRMININDAEFIFKLRSNPKLNKYIHSGANTLADQIIWINKYLNRKDDYYFLIETIKERKPVGVISIYDIKDKKAEWGRWIIDEGTNYAIESVYLIYKVAFEIIKLDIIYCRTVKENKSVVSFHESCGIKKKNNLQNYFFLEDKYYDAVEHILDRYDWILVEKKLRKLSFLISKKNK